MQTPSPTSVSPPAKMSEVGSLNLSGGNPYRVYTVDAAFIASKDVFAYFYVSARENVLEADILARKLVANELVKVRLSDFKKVSALSVSGYPIFDPTGEFAYLAGSGRIVKVRLSDFAEVKTLLLEEISPAAGVVDAKGEYGYFSAWSENQDGEGVTQEVVKVRLSDLTVAGSVKLVEKAALIQASRVGLIDAGGKFAYFDAQPEKTTASFDDDWKLSKIRLEDFTKTEEIAFSAREVGQVLSGAIDPKGEFAYIGTTGLVFGGSSKLLKIRLSDMRTEEGLELAAVNSVDVVAVEPNGEYAYFATENEFSLALEEEFPPKKITRIRLRDFTKADSLKLKEFPIYSIAIEPSGKFAYAGTTEGTVLKIRLK